VSIATLGAVLASARDLGVDRLDAQLLAAHVLGRERAWVIAHEDEALDMGAAAALRALLQCRAAGEPLAYLTGEREFHGLSLQVTPDVLVPRPDTETLVDWALELLAGPLAALHAPHVIDLGTGSGAIALAIKHACPRARIHASDLSAAALAVAQCNGQRLGLQIEWHQGEWWSAAPPGRFDLALSNPPYVAAGDPHLAALCHEPALALVPAGDGGNGLADLERVVAGAGARLNPNGWLLLEHGADQGEAVRRLLTAAGFDTPTTRCDLAGHSRIGGASLPAPERGIPAQR
jgi:release factor glutamine methyltransferase